MNNECSLIKQLFSQWCLLYDVNIWNNWIYTYFCFSLAFYTYALFFAHFIHQPLSSYISIIQYQCQKKDNILPEKFQCFCGDVFHIHLNLFWITIKMLLSSNVTWKIYCFLLKKLNLTKKNYFIKWTLLKVISYWKQ